MYRFIVAALLLSPGLVFAQDIKCPKGYQPYANRCVSQRMADYISCVEASGGNRQEMIEEVTELGGQKSSTNVKVSGSGTVVKGSGGLALDKSAEKALAKRWETRWFQGGMSECSKLLDKPTSREMKKAVKDAMRETSPQLSGVILPGNKPTPHVSPCIPDIPKGSIILIYGDSVSYTNDFPHTVIQSGDQPLLVIGEKNGGATISGRFFSADSKIVAEIKDNHFFVNPNNYFRIERPNKHVLIVYDQQGHQALNVEYLNPSTIKLLGRFNFPDSPPVIISEKGIRRKGMPYISRVCMELPKGASDITLP
jgi:hypothetical protein